MKGVFQREEEKAEKILEKKKESLHEWKNYSDSCEGGVLAFYCNSNEI